MPAARLQSSRSPKPTPPPFRSRIWSAGRWLVVAVGLSITFGVFFLTALRVATHAREVRVPDVHGQSLTAATAALSQVGLTLQIEQRRPDATVPADHVLSQDPPPGSTIRQQRAIRVRVSEGLRAPVLPTLVGQPERSADAVLSQQQVSVAARDEIHDASYPPDIIVAQDPAPKEHSATVSLLVNRGGSGESFVMPDVIGTLGIRVVDILRRHGFRVSVSAEVPYPGLPPGVVVAQTPQAGFQIGYGEAVQLEVSR